WHDIFSDAKAFHCSGITCAVSQSAADATFEAVKTAKEMGLTVTCDINYRKNLWKYGADAHTVLHELMQYSDFIFGDQNEWEVATHVPHIPVNNMYVDTEFDMKAYKAYFEEMHKQFPRCKQMLLALRNQISTNHHTLTGFLWSEGEIYSAKIYDIYPVLDPMGVGDAYVAAYIHATLKWQDPQRSLDFALAASQLKNSISGDFNLVTEDEILQFM
ncbi:MAG: sugar kinase, partial [Prevotella sp.]|nr:sugar kinase [Prevotella sp.]